MSTGPASPPLSSGTPPASGPPAAVTFIAPPGTVAPGAVTADAISANASQCIDVTPVAAAAGLLQLLTAAEPTAGVSTLTALP
jgi:hypothetical protein